MKIENWFIGIVEETADPMQAGRVRVRCLSYHTPDHTMLPTENLLWAQCVLPVDNAGIGQVGSFAVGLLPGSWVLGFFRDGTDMQDPVVMGGFSGAAGTSINYQDNFGYGDPHGAFKYSSFMNNFPSDSNTFESTNGYSSATSAFTSSFVGGIQDSTSPLSSSFETPKEPVILSGNGIEDLIAVARGELGTSEGKPPLNKGAVSKYWAGGKTAGWDGSNTSGKGAPWCAIFVSWCVEQSKIIPDPKDNPRTAGVSAFVSWARKKPFITLRANPRKVYKGDIVTIRGGSHIGIAISDSDSAGVYESIDGNGPSSAVAIRKPRRCVKTAYAMSWNITSTPPKPEPAIVASARTIPQANS